MAEITKNDFINKLLNIYSPDLGILDYAECYNEQHNIGDRVYYFGLFYYNTDFAEVIPFYRALVRLSITKTNSYLTDAEITNIIENTFSGGIYKCLNKYRKYDDGTNFTQEFDFIVINNDTNISISQTISDTYSGYVVGVVF